MAPYESPVWKYFRKDKRNDAKKSATCKICKCSLIMSQSSTSSLRKHLKSKHGDTYKQFLVDETTARDDFERANQEVDQAEADAGKPAKQNKPNTAKWGKQDDKQLKIDIDVAAWIARSNQPFSVVDSAGFKEMMSAMNPRYNVKAPQTYASNKIPLIYEVLHDAREAVLAKELPDVGQVGLTFDHWSSRNNDPYLVVTLHYINKDFVMRKMTCALVHQPEKHTGANIAEMVDQQIERIPPLFDIQKRLAVVDQAPNMRAAVNASNYLASFEEGSNHCFDHKVNTSLEHAVNNCEQLKDALAAAKTVTSKLHQSFKFEGIVSKACRKLKLNYVKVPAPSPTRWNSHQIMVSGILKMEQALKKAAEDPEFDCVLPTEAQYKILANVLPLLTYIREMSEKMSADRQCTMDKAMLMINRIHRKMHLLKLSLECPELDDFVDHLNSQFIQRFPSQGGKISPYAFGHLLHPFYKGFLLKKWDLYVSQLVDQHPTTIKHLNKSNEDTLAVEKSVEDTIAGELECDDADLAQEVLTQMKEKKLSEHHAPIKEEWLNFVERNQADVKVDVLKWWKDHAKEYPLLAKEARNVYGIPATSATAERSFSQAGLVVTDKRTNLNTRTVEMLCFINQNYEMLTPFVKDWKIHSAQELMEGHSQDSDDPNDGALMDSTHIDTQSGQDFLGPSVPEWTPRGQRLKRKADDPTPGPSGTKKKPRPDKPDKPEKPKQPDFGEEDDD